MVNQFKVTLKDVEPSVWRRIQVPDRYSFWDLHCAITDAFGWLDCHLHCFTVPDWPDYPHPKKPQRIGIPENPSDASVLPSWEVKADEFFFDAGNGTHDGVESEYLYDFGDAWRHAVVFEKGLPEEVGVQYPRCIDGANACPPEDVGGHWGYERFLKAIAYLNSPDHEMMLEWCGGWFDPTWFDQSFIEFDCPVTRWQVACEGVARPKRFRSVQYHRMKPRNSG